MKSEVQHNSEKIFDKVQVDSTRNQHNDVVLFPKKVAKAKEAFEKFGLPKVENRNR